MRRLTICQVLTVLVAIVLLQPVNAYHYGIDSFHGPHASYHYDPYYNVGSTCLSFNEWGCSHGYPSYRYRDLGSWDFDRDNDWGWGFNRNNDWRWELNKRRTVRWLDRSYNSRYDVARGRTSGSVFGGVNEPARSSSNWRFKTAYDPQVDGRGTNSRYYYKPRVDSKWGYVNWRY